MKSLFGASLTFSVAALLSLSAAAADLPQVKISDGNAVPACATPGRLMAYLHARNPRVDPRFEGVATEYMRHGEALGLRWDIAFFQMVLETGALSFTGDVRADQNNFAGLGASGGGAHGERFANISNGVKAHLQHLLMYSGEHIADPVADRTRKVQEWGVLTDWQKSIKGPMTYTLVARQWAPTSRNYVRDISTITDGFYSGFCNGPDPQPQMVQEARGGHAGKARTQVAATKQKTQVAAAKTEAPDTAKVVPDPATQTADAGNAADKVSGADIAKRSIEEERKEAAPRTALGAGMLGNVASAAKAAADQQQAQKSVDEPPVTLLNAKQDPQAESTADAGAAVPEAKAEVKPATTADAKATAKAEAKPAAKADAKAVATAEAKPAAKVAKADVKADTKTDPKAAAKAPTKATAKAEPSVSSDKGAAVQTASIAGAATQLKLPAKAASKCKVWTASYGGQRAVIIKASTAGSTNYTVLDVTEANEKREIDAYIAAYAKGGEKVASFPTQTKALNKAFELCPEG